MTEPWLKSFQKCECGYGEGFYCLGKPDESHEYNPRVNEAVGTADDWADRKPPYSFFGAISGSYIIVSDNEAQRDIAKIRYTDHASRLEAFREAAVLVKAHSKQGVLV